MYTFTSHSFLKFILIVSLLMLTACGYRWGHGGIATQYRTITVPFVEGDWNGDLTAILVKEVAQMGTLQYCSYGGDLILKVRVLDYREEEIGFRYDRKKRGDIKKSIIPDENRVYLCVEVQVIDSATNCSVIGPVKISAFVEYDHDYYSVRNAVNVFSLGQLTDIDEARESAEQPLNRQMAKKIVAYVNDSW